MEFCHDFQNGRCNRSTCRCQITKGEKEKRKQMTQKKREQGERESEKEKKMVREEKESKRTDQILNVCHMPDSSIAMVMLKQNFSILVISLLV